MKVDTAANQSTTTCESHPRELVLAADTPLAAVDASSLAELESTSDDCCRSNDRLLLLALSLHSWLVWMIP